ncbi:MAG TPA: hypothetical protein VEP49_21100 [Acidimicrobiia bacterium]|nr:hypothetical protein [Acidimicrobiia bacterium]
MSIDALARRALRHEYRSATLLLVLSAVGLPMLFVGVDEDSVFADPLLVVAGPSTWFSLILLLVSIESFVSALRLRRDLQRGTWKRVPCRIVIDPTSPKRRRLQLEAGPDRWRTIDALRVRELRARHLDDVGALDVLRYRPWSVVYRVPAAPRLFRGRFVLDLSDDASPETVREVIEAAGLPPATDSGSRGLFTDSVLVFRRRRHAVDVFGSNGHLLGSIAHRETHAEIFDITGRRVLGVRVDGRHSRTVDRDGLEVARVHGVFGVRITAKGTRVGKVRGNTERFMIFDERGASVARVVGDSGPLIAAISDGIPDPVRCVVVAAPLLAEILPEPGDGD